jgi:hypothetical protein
VFYTLVAVLNRRIYMFLKFIKFLFCFSMFVCSFVVNADSNIDGISNVSVSKNRPIPKTEWDDSVKLWVARSCAGEAGFDAVDECIGIAWVYATRWKGAKNSKMKFVDVVRKYSAAIKYRSTHTRRWILNLNLKGKKPVGWPHRLKWSNHRDMWNDILSALEDWSKGGKPNPVLGADHFGGKMDKPGRYWVRIVPSNGMKFRNRFYRSPWAPPVLVD